MAYIRYEERYLLALTAAMINQTKPPVPVRRIDWGAVFRLADFHEIANVVYYGLLGVEGVPQNWRERFYGRYLEYVNHITPLEEAEFLVKEVLERSGIPAVVLRGSHIRGFYPVQEMSLEERIDILTVEGARREIRSVLEELDFEWRRGGEKGSSLYYRIPGAWLCIREELDFTSKEMKRYFRGFLGRMSAHEEYQFITEMSPELEYIYQICRITERYATGEIEIRDLMNLWMLLKKHQKTLDFHFIAKEVSGVIPANFFQHITTLTDIWFGKKDMPQGELDVYEAMEAYILTKGESGWEMSSKLLPLIKTVADNYQRNRRREAFNKKVRWIFPEYEYMVTLYPMLESAEILLPACWLFRILRTVVSYVEMWLGKYIGAPVKRKYVQMKEGLNRAVGFCKKKLKKR